MFSYMIKLHVFDINRKPFENGRQWCLFHIDILKTFQVIEVLILKIYMLSLPDFEHISPISPCFVLTYASKVKPSITNHHRTILLLPNVSLYIIKMYLYWE